MRIAIIGGPRTGKTTLAAKLARGRVVYHTDDLIGLGWSEASEHAADWFEFSGSFVVEGVATVRALRKWLRRDRPGRPVDRVLYLTRPHEPLSEGQRRMAKGVETVWAEIQEELLDRGVGVVID